MGAESNQAMNSAGPVEGVTTEKVNVWSMMVGVFTSPQQAFSKFDKAPRILIPLVVYLVLTVVSASFSSKYGAMAQYDMFAQHGSLPAQAMDRMQQKVMESGGIVDGLIGGAVTLLPLIIFSLFAWGIGNFIFGGQTTFKKIFGVSLLGSLIVAIGNLIKLPLMIARESMYVSLGPAALFPDKDFTSLLYSFLYYLDLFSIWSLIVTGFGFAAIYRFSTGRGMAISIIATLLIMIGSLGLTAFGLGLAGIEVSIF
jgi:hypothetical protein